MGMSLCRTLNDQVQLVMSHNNDHAKVSLQGVGWKTSRALVFS